MSSRITNLNRFRKDKAKSEKRAQADANSIKFGRTKAEKSSDSAKRDAAQKLLDGHKIPK